MTRALFAKAWCESRARFVVASAFVILACATFVIFEATFRSRMVLTGGPALTFVEYVDARIFRSVVRALYLLLAVVLGLGGLARERGQGTLGFTLALPVPRAHHVLARAAVGAAQLVALAAAPVILVAPTAYPLGDALAHAATWLVLAAPIFATGVLISVLIPNEYAALAVAVVGLRFLPQVTPLRVDGPVAVMVALGGALAAMALATQLVRRSRP